MSDRVENYSCWFSHALAHTYLPIMIDFNITNRLGQNYDILHNFKSDWALRAVGPGIEITHFKSLPRHHAKLDKMNNKRTKTLSKYIITRKEKLNKMFPSEAAIRLTSAKLDVVRAHDNEKKRTSRKHKDKFQQIQIGKVSKEITGISVSLSIV